ncbi:MAG: cobyric acid synthase CobQ [Thermodesulfovibrio sp.]|nr:cobyric acid synthase CobQ [Thermodesulfovibrio sp.]
MAKSLMIQGTGSGAGKSLIVTALCRIFSDMGLNVAPFKAQNMALNSYVSAEGGEMGRAQVLQAEAARVRPSIHMNPILLKASDEKGSQVIIHGRVHSTMKAQEYYAFKKQAWEAVKMSLNKLLNSYELAVIEGAGSPAEINLMDADIVNMAVAKHAKAPVILVGDIDKGGVFASLYGTVKLLGKNGRYIKAFLINKFRGDLNILKPGLGMIREKTGRPVIGVIPYIKNISLPEEDGLALYQKAEVGSQKAEIKIVILKLQFISNFTDFDPISYEPDVELIYSNNPSEIENADIVIIPGSKNTVKDLVLLKQTGIEAGIKRAYSKGIQIIGICGGYQMLGKIIYDPHEIESGHKEIEGIGLLDIGTKFGKEKVTCRVEAELVRSYEFGVMSSEDMKLKGYEIHMGESKGNIGLFKLKRLSITSELQNQDSIILEGSRNGNCWGTYIHGIFENDIFRRSVLNQVRLKKGLSPLESSINYSEIKGRAIDNLAAIFIENTDMDFIKRLIKI